MSAALTAIGAFLDAVAKLFRAAIALLLAAILIINAANIFSRSLFGVAFDWVFHWTILMFVWLVCLGFYAYLQAGRDVVVELIAKRTPMAVRRALAVAADLVGLVFMYMILSPAVAFLSLQTGNMETIALPIWVRSLPLFITAVFLTLHFVVHALQVIIGDVEPFAGAQHGSDEKAGAPQ